MMKRLMIGITAAITLFAVGCSKEVEDLGPPPDPSPYTRLFIKFTHNVSGVDLNSSDTIIYENLPGNFYSVNNLRYLISDVRLNDFNYNNYQLGEHHLIDVKDETTLIWDVKDSILSGHYASISLFVGFQEEKNKTGEYPELDNLDCQCWSWKPIWGGGYYTLRLDGKYLDDSSDPIPDPYDMGLGGNKLVVTSTDTTYEPNEIIASLKDSGFEIPVGTSTVTIEIKMDVNRLFESASGMPNFNLKIYPNNLEVNAAGSATLSSNLSTAFRLGSVTYNKDPSKE